MHALHTHIFRSRKRCFAFERCADCEAHSGRPADNVQVACGRVSRAAGRPVFVARAAPVWRLFGTLLCGAAPAALGESNASLYAAALGGRGRGGGENFPNHRSGSSGGALPLISPPRAAAARRDAMPQRLASGPAGPDA